MRVVVVRLVAVIGLFACGDDSVPVSDASVDSTARVCTADAECDDALFCNGAETCSAGRCLEGTPPAVDDGLDCTADVCDEGAGAVSHVPDSGLCDDGMYCNGIETCDAAAGCISTPPVLDDGVACTVDTCDEAMDVVLHSPEDGACDDGLFCNGAEVCDGALGCAPGIAPVTDDEVACTNDRCDEALDAVVNEPDDGACDDGDACTDDTCTAGVGCSYPFVCTCRTAADCSDGNPCTTDACAAGSCTYVNNTASCDDGLYCNGADVCSAGSCTHAGDPCAAGGVCARTCNEAADHCFAAAGATCTEDGNPCTDDRCDGAGGCTHPPNTAPCGDGLYCNGADVCALGSCVHRGDPCAAGAECNNTCNETTDACATPGGVVCTSDGNVCTDDRCNGSGTCAHSPNTAPCDDGMYCNGADRCAGGSCGHSGNPCAGGAVCMNACNESRDDCYSAAGSMCTDDGVACTADVCDGAGTCTHVAAPEAACANAADDDCDGTTDCADADCAGDPCGPGGATCSGAACMCPGGPSETLCTNGLDDDCDGTTDCADADCASMPLCACSRPRCMPGVCAPPLTCLGGTCGRGGSYGWDRVWGAGSADYAGSVLATADGYYVSGGFSGMVNFGGGVRAAAGSSDGFLVAFGADGSYRWDRVWASAWFDAIAGLDADGAGNLVAVGRVHSSATVQNGVVRKFDSAGTEIWSRSYGTDVSPASVSIDNAGNVVVVGYYSGTADFGGGMRTSVEDQDVFVLSLTSAGDYRWDHVVSGGGLWDVAYDVDTDSMGNLYVVGEYWSQIDFGGGPTMMRPAGAYVVSFTSEGTWRWDRTFGSTQPDAASSVVVTQLGDVVVAGSFGATTDFGGGMRSSSGWVDGVLFALDTDGRYRWDRVYGSAVDNDRVDGVAVDCAGNIIATGMFEGSVDFGGGARTSAGDRDVFVLSLTPAGGYRWDRTFGGSGADRGLGAAITTSGRTVTVGSWSTTTDFGGGARTSGGGTDAFVLELAD